MIEALSLNVFGSLRSAGLVTVSLGLRTLNVVFSLLHPPVLVFLSPACDGECAGRNVLGNRGSSADVSALPDFDRRDDRCIASDEGAILDDRRAFDAAIVVACDGAGADIDVGTDGGITKIRQMIGFAPRAKRRFLQLDEIPDMGVRTDVGTRSQVRERP